MLYKKINIELIVVADEAEAVVEGLSATLDRLEEKHTLFGGGIETVPVKHPGTRKKSALARTMAAGEKVADAIRATREGVSVTFPRGPARYSYQRHSPAIRHTQVLPQALTGMTTSAAAART